MRSLSWTFACLAFLSLSAGRIAAEDAKAPSQEQLEKKFETLMSGCVLDGHYTMWGGGDKPAADKYTIEKVEKVKDDIWRFTARIQYGMIDVKLPLELEVKWAGDTPVITLDKFKVLGIGTFSCRIVIHGDQYAGTWDGGDHGGHMYGKIEKIKVEEKKAK